MAYPDDNDPINPDECCDNEPLRYRLNPCDYARFSFLQPLGEGIANVFRWAMYGTGGCPCCMGTRLILYTAGATTLGYLLGA